MFRRLISFEEAVNSIKDHCPLKPVGIESVLLREASGRVLAEDVISDLDIPPFDRSTVDGYAVRSEDTYGVDDENPKVLKICGEIKIGETPRVSVRVGEAAQIPTGAPIPEGADAVVMVEYTVTRKDRVEVFRPVYRGENIMRKGTDVSKGELVLKRGETLTPAYIGVLAAIGKERVNIYARPKIAILSTGPEIVVPGKPLPYGKIYDINSYTLATAANLGEGRCCSNFWRGLRGTHGSPTESFEPLKREGACLFRGGDKAGEAYNVRCYRRETRLQPSRSSNLRPNHILLIRSTFTPEVDGKRGGSL